MFQHYAAFKHMSVRDNVAFGLSIRHEKKAVIRARVDELLEIVGLTRLGGSLPVAALAAASASGWRWRARWPSQPQVLLLDEPFGALDANVRQELREWLRRLHDEVHVTTVLVTHDQEEAMAIADRIVVLDRGHGPAGRARRASSTSSRPTRSSCASSGRSRGWATVLVRPHDLVLSTEPATARSRRWSTRVVYLGFEVRVELELAVVGEPVSVQLTRGEADELELAPGDIVHVRAAAEPAFSA